MREGTFFEELTVKLTPDEVNERAKEGCPKALELEALTEVNNEKRKALKAAEKELQDRLLELAAIARDKQERRQVECIDVLRGVMVETIRTDTHEVTRARAATKEELGALQETLFPGGGARKKVNEKADEQN